MKTTTYKGETIDHNLSGVYSCFMLNVGFLKGYTISGLKGLIDKQLKEGVTK